MLALAPRDGCARSGRGNGSSGPCSLNVVVRCAERKTQKRWRVLARPCSPLLYHQPALFLLSICLVDKEPPQAHRQTQGPSTAPSLVPICIPYSWMCCPPIFLQLLSFPSHEYFRTADQWLFSAPSLLSADFAVLTPLSFGISWVQVTETHLKLKPKERLDVDPVLHKWPECQSLKQSVCPSSPSSRAPHKLQGGKKLSIK
ncbi:uncharacterized protein [Manis javanica]|uniref:uncharacterized protein isoform X2 n=1 Tax=Manis javanica TaxID=9974 RepID=UPI003C6CF184